VEPASLWRAEGWGDKSAPNEAARTILAGERALITSNKTLFMNRRPALAQLDRYYLAGRRSQSSI